MASLKNPRRLEVYISYVHQDMRFLDELMSHLNVLKRSGLIATWSDRDLVPGSQWRQEIERHLNTAHIILLLVSPDFLSSAYAHGVELRRTMERHDRGEARVLPIILRPCEWFDTPFSKLQALPQGAKPVSQWDDRDAAFFDIARGIRDIVNFIQKELDEQINWLEEGDRYFQDQRFTDALDAYEKARLMDPTNVYAYIGRGHVLRSLGRPLEALASYEEAIRQSPQNGLAYIGRGHALSDQDLFDEALIAYNQALQLTPDNLAALLGKGQALYRLQHYKEALHCYQSLLHLAGNDAHTYMSVGTILSTLERWEEALAAYQKVLELSPTDIEAYLASSEALRHLQRYEEALLQVDKAIVLDANNSLVYGVRIAILQELGRTEEALRAQAAAAKLGFHIQSSLYSTSTLDSETLYHISPATLQQFLEKAGFELTPLTEGFLATPRHANWQRWFQKSKVFVRIIFERPLDPRTVRSIAITARRYQSKHALVITNQQPELDGWNEINILRGEEEGRRCICLTIDEALIQNALAQNTELSDLLTYVQNNLGEGFDPYHEKNPVSGTISFFGRQHIIDTLLADLQAGHHSGIFGLQKMGKSSLMYELRRKAEFPVAYVYLHDSDELSSVYRQILTGWEVNGRIKYSDFSWTSPLTERYAHVTHSMFTEAAKSLLDHLRSQNKLLPLAGVFLDEVGHFVPPTGNHEKMERFVYLMDALRGLHQETQSVPLLVAGVHPGVARHNYFWGSQKNPMYQIITEHFLPPMEDKDCRNMILFLGKQIGLEYQEDALEHILNLSGSHPYMTRHLCSLINSQHKGTRVISTEMVEKIALEFVRNPAMNAYFNEHGLWNELRDEDTWTSEVGQANHELLLKLAGSNADLSEDDLCSGFNEHILQEAFYALKERRIITSPHSDGYYRITFDIFRRWIRLRQLHIKQD